MTNITQLIKDAIANTANLRSDSGITTVEGMIPAMDKADYPAKYLLDVAYGESESAKMDIYYPEDGEGPFPVFVEVHGGAWYFGQKSSIEFKPFLHGLKRGYVCVSLGYTLSPEAVYPQAVLEIKQAIRYLKSHAEELHINPWKIALWGGSAGAHLAALAAYSECSGYLCEDGVDSDFVQALVLWYGCFNYHLGKQLDYWVYQNFYGEENLAQVNTEILLSNPAVHVTKNVPPTFLQHGRADMVVPYEQSVYLYHAIKSIAGEERCQLELLDNCDHADVKLFAEENIRKVFDFIDERMK